MKRFFLFLVALLAVVSIRAQRHDGTTCDRAIEVNGQYRASISKAGEYWYAAWTYDLPMQVTFTIADTFHAVTPQVEVDFSCTGVYDDPRLTELFDKSTGSYADLPFVLSCDSTDTGTTRTYTLNVGDKYRTLLVQAGITDNLRALVHVTIDRAGVVEATPDSASGACLRASTMVNLGDTLHIEANDSTSTFTLPISGWKHDSVRFVWLGQQDSLHVDMAVKYCQFSSTTRDSISEHFDLDAMDSKKYTVDGVQELIDRYTFGGNVYYAHFISTEAADLIIEKVPTTPGAGGAKTLRLGRATQLPANDTTVYCFYKTWTATTFSTPTNHIFHMYVGRTPDIRPEDATSYLAHYQYQVDAYGAHRLDINTQEMRNLTAQAKDNYLYVRFVCAAATSILPTTLDDDCVNRSNGAIVTNEKITVQAYTENTTFYRLFFPAWRHDSIRITWSGAQKAELFIDDICDFAAKSSTNLVDYLTLNPRGTKTLSAAYVEKYWVQKNKIADLAGYIYLRCKSTASGNLTFTAVDKQQEQEPEPSAFTQLSVRIACTDVPADGHLAYTVYVSLPQELTLTMDDGTPSGKVVRTWNQTPAETYTLASSLPSGNYTLLSSVHPDTPIRFVIP